jgi:hypothetical protein
MIGNFISTDRSVRLQTALGRKILQAYAVPDWSDADLLVDINLSVFGRSSETVDRYDAAIR